MSYGASILAVKQVSKTGRTGILAVSACNGMCHHITSSSLSMCRQEANGTH